MLEFLESIEELLDWYAGALENIDSNIVIAMDNFKMFVEYFDKQIFAFHGYAIFICVAMIALLIMNIFLLKNQKRTRKELHEIIETLKQNSEN